MYDIPGLAADRTAMQAGATYRDSESDMGALRQKASNFDVIHKLQDRSTNEERLSEGDSSSDDSLSNYDDDDEFSGGDRQLLKAESM